ncbi:MAG: hypothetical protein CBC48_18785 [bacterium TMED88]|nr:hypothetical protein [Deltaproteobacteria bacterium]OUV23492.1 MAG: hypothetical protein CBC48_18785 [bacterium TMED88]
MVKSHAEESLGANPGDAALNPADSVAMGVPSAQAPKGSSPVARPGLFNAIRHRAFRLLFISFLINQTGFWISHISLQGLTVELTHNDTRQSGFLFFALFVPAFAFAPIAGVVADRLDRKRIVLSCYLSVAILTTVLAWLTNAGDISPSMLLVIAFGMGTAFAFSGPASMAIAANSVPRDDLSSAVSLQSAANNLTRVVGPLLAAPMVATSRFEISFTLYAAAATVAAILTAMMKIERYAPDAEEGGLFARILGGFEHAKKKKPALPALLTVATLSFFGVSHVVLLPAFAQDVLGDPSMFAWIVAVTGVGAMAGALSVGRSSRAPTLRGAALGVAAFGLSLGLFAATRSIVLALVSQLVLGYFYFAVMTGLQTLIQEVVDETKRGRVMSLFQVCWAGLIPFGSLLLGYLAAPLGAPTTLMAAAGICVIYGWAMAWLAPRWDRSHG